MGKILAGDDIAVRSPLAAVSKLNGRPVFITHGELPAATALANELRATKGWNTVVPKLGEKFELEGEIARPGGPG